MRGSFWTGAGEKFELCYLAHDVSGWSEPVDLGEVARFSGGHLATRGNGATLAVWAQPEGKLVARWIQPGSMETGDTMQGDPLSGVKSKAVSPACAGAGYAAGGVVPEPLAGKQSRQSMPRLGITPEAAQQLVLPDEHVEQVFGHAVWYGETAGVMARARKWAKGGAPIGDIVVADKSLLFTISASDEGGRDAPAQKVRIAYQDIEAFRLGTFGLNRWVVLRTKDGHEQYFAILKGDGVPDRHATQAAVDLLRSKLASPAAE